jgi:hypothetical protein
MAQPPPEDQALLVSLEHRAGVETTVVLRDGRQLTVYDIARASCAGSHRDASPGQSPGMPTVRVPGSESRASTRQGYAPPGALSQRREQVNVGST